MEDARIFVAVPYYGTIWPRFTNNLIALIVHLCNVGIDKHFYDSCDGISLHRAQNGLVCRFLRSPCTHIFFLEQDMIIEPELPLRLAEHDLDIVGAGYTHKHVAPQPHLYQYKRKDEFGYIYDKIEEFEDGLVEVDATGSGALLVKREVFESLIPNWLEIDEKSFEGPEWFSYRERGTTDFFFCRKAKEAGYKIYVDTTLHAIHLRLGEATWDQWLRMKEKEKENGNLTK